jgi:hypothetical protein
MSSNRHFKAGYFDLLAAIRRVGGVPCETAPKLFFPEEILDQQARIVATNAAKKLCQKCPIIDQCYEYAVNAPEEYGVWGGTSATER